MENLLSDAEMEAVIDGDHGNVFAVLGIHRDKGSKEVFIRAFQPHAKAIEVTWSRRCFRAVYDPFG